MVVNFLIALIFFFPLKSTEQIFKLKNYSFSEMFMKNWNFQMEGKPPKLWLAWIYRNYLKDPAYIRKKVEKLFGKNAEPGKMFIFKNTASQNAELWPLKHIIEIRPLTFPNGEPTIDDVNALEVSVNFNLYKRKIALGVPNIF
ncbi:unnamed protein product [Gongylonema pulchrum]|uniref:Uncharacterized protein n=1 Tax=Gongylonema pulchrum TaxID=637853 RepID=A0A3P6RRD6_9BILA|nr:unnamed protein product [Gongylonema pulchrum]